ncbi:MAG: tRNA (guanosine(46)-N7)-methyltransferase TrmB [Bacilli bacterium]|jgi:tRNA (guanine-N7-)-methyltransferase|nr:tRNA (guanosine(46)-N7)-methyltransferase TrmB [Bacilli bacterium]
MRLRHKPWADDLLQAHKEVALNDNDLPSLPPFNCLEIGSGCGEFLIQMASAHPENSYLGAEVANTAFAIAIKKLVGEEKYPHNLIFINTPAEKLMEFVSPSSLDRIFLNFSDPWPKKRHHKRRLTYPTRLAEYYAALKKGGVLAFKTDNDDLYMDSVGYFKTFGKFHFTSIDDYKVEAEDDFPSEYEKKFRLKGVKIHRIVAVKEED